MNKRSNTVVSILIGLNLVLPCVAQTSQAEKGNPGLEQKICRDTRKCGLLSSRVVGSRIGSIVRHTSADRPEQRYRSREFPAARQNQLR
jgi:hypothetical protein